MKRYIFSVMIAAAMLPACFFAFGEQACAQQYPGTDLLNIAPSNPGKTRIEVSYGKSKDHIFKQGERVIFNVTGNADGYLWIFNVSKDGNIVVLFPNKSVSDNRIQTGKPYVLFAEDQGPQLLMGGGLSESRTVFFLTSRQLPDSLTKPPAGKDAVLRIPAQDPRVSELLDKLKECSSEPDFGSLVLTLKCEGDAGPDVKLMGPPPKGLPTGSDIPETVTGTQGAKDPIKR
jgi:hypothetical protein